MTLAPLRLKKGEDRRLRSGHPWVFSNEINVQETPLGGFEAGQQVVIEDAKGIALGVAYVNPRTLICARLVSRNPKAALDHALLRERIQSALALRERLFALHYYRLVYGDSDRLPGLVVDRFNDTLVVQITTAGMELVKEHIVEVLTELLRPKVIVLRNDSASREVEGLASYVSTPVGDAPDTITVEENGARFEAPLLTGQKTGWFYDHRQNRARMQTYVAGKKVLDMFSYVGGWGVQAAVAGAAQVVCVDSSDKALGYARSNAALNNKASQFTTRSADAFDALHALAQEKQKFDVIILDPPAFIKRKKDHAAGIEAYQRLNRLAMQVLCDDGILISASCSFHLTADELLRATLRASRSSHKELQILEQGHQAADHPVHPAIPETAYLKTFFGRVQNAD